MGQTPFESFAANLGAAFTAGFSTATANGLAAISAPLMTVVMLWIIVQGILVMRGDMDARGGVTRIIRVALVVGLLTSAGLYTSYVQNLFQTTLPNWIAASIVGGGAVNNVPLAFDQIWNTTAHDITTVQAQLSWMDFTDGVSLALIGLGTNFILLVMFAVYEISQAMIGIVIAAGPFIVAGFLFEATKRVTENWLGKLVGLTILTLLVNIALAVILQGDESYLRAITANLGAGGVPAQVQVLFELAMFLGISGFIVLLLPGIAAAIGGGIGVDVGGMVRGVTRVITGGVTGGASVAAGAATGAVGGIRGAAGAVRGAAGA